MMSTATLSYEQVKIIEKQFGKVHDNCRIIFYKKNNTFAESLND